MLATQMNNRMPNTPMSANAGLHWHAALLIKTAVQTEPRMPTLFRFLFILAVIAGVIYGSMMALVLLVEPKERDVTVRVPSERLNPPATTAPAKP